MAQRTVSIRIPDEMHRELQFWARLQTLSLGQVLEQAWAAWLEAHPDAAAAVKAAVDAVEHDR